MLQADGENEVRGYGLKHQKEKRSIGLLLEERDLVTFHGDAYIEYHKHVSMIVPRPPKRI